jgi:hypothetical protein
VCATIKTYVEITKHYYFDHLRDPDSALYESISTPQKFWYGNKIDGASYGYLVCVTYNAKNRYGGYVGYKTEGLILRDGKVAYFLKKGQLDSGKPVCN